LDSKIDCVEKLFVLKNYLDSKIDLMEKPLGFKNYLYFKTTYIENLFQTSKKRKFLKMV